MLLSDTRRSDWHNELILITTCSDIEWLLVCTQHSCISLVRRPLSDPATKLVCTCAVATRFCHWCGIPCSGVVSEKASSEVRLRHKHGTFRVLQHINKVLLLPTPDTHNYHVLYISSSQHSTPTSAVWTLTTLSEDFLQLPCLSSSATVPVKSVKSHAPHKP